MFRRMPKRGFSNFKFAQRYEVVNVSQLERFEDGSAVGLQTLCDVGLIDSCRQQSEDSRGRRADQTFAGGRTQVQQVRRAEDYRLRRNGGDYIASGL